MEQNASGACVFCEIAKGTVPASMVFADEHVLVDSLPVRAELLAALLNTPGP